MKIYNVVLQKGRINLNDALIKIPGTTYYLQFGIEGKYYAVFLIQGRQAIQSKKLNILRGTSLHELPEEVENGLKSMLEAEEVYISPVVVDRVVNNLLEKIPQDGQMEVKEAPAEGGELSSSVSVKNMVAHSDHRSGIRSVIEHHPGQKSQFDATADSIGRIELKKPKPLPLKDSMVQRETPAATEVETTSTIPKPQPTKTATESYVSMDDKVNTLTNEISQLVEQVTKNDKEIKKMKKQITKLKKDLKEATALEPE